MKILKRFLSFLFLQKISLQKFSFPKIVSIVLMVSLASPSSFLHAMMKEKEKEKEKEEMEMPLSFGLTENLNEALEELMEGEEDILWTAKSQLGPEFQESPYPEEILEDSLKELVDFSPARTRVPALEPLDKFLKTLEARKKDHSGEPCERVFSRLLEYYEDCYDNYLKNPLSPKVPLRSDLGKAYRIPSERAKAFRKKISSGKVFSSNLSFGSLKIREIEAPLDFREEMSTYHFYGSLFKEMSFPFSVLRIGQREPFFSVASYEPKGMPLKEFMKEKSLDSLSSYDVSALIVGTLWTNQTDLSLDNFWVVDQGDVYSLLLRKSGQSFSPPVKWVVDTEVFPPVSAHYLGIKNVLYALPELMKKKMNPQVVAEIKALLPEVSLLRWLGALAQQSRLQESLGLSLEEKEKLGFPFRIPSSALGDLIKDIKSTQSILLETSDITHQQLFERLRPLPARYYAEPRGVRGILRELGFSRWIKEQSFEEILDPRSKLRKGLFVFQALRKERESGRKPEESLYSLLQKLVDELNLSLYKAEVLREIFEGAAKNFPQEILNSSNDLWKNESLFFKVLQGKEPSFALASLMQSQGVQFKEKNREGNTRLHKTILKMKVDPQKALKTLKGLLPSCPDRDAFNYSFMSPLELAVEAFLENDISPRRDSEIGKALGEAFQVLVEGGAGKNIRTPSLFVNYYRVLKKKNLWNQGAQSLFEILEERNPSLKWLMAWEHILPLAVSRKGEKASEEQEGKVIQTATLGDRILSSAVEESIQKRASPFGRSHTGRAQKGRYSLYFKYAPECPGFECAVGDLCRRILGGGAPYAELIRLDEKPVLVSEFIEGFTLQEVCESHPDLLSSLEPKNLSKMILLTMILNPEDEQPANVIFQKGKEGGQLVRIDNDHALVSPLASEYQEGGEKRFIQVKSIFYCLDQMKAVVDTEARALFTSLNGVGVLQEWIHDLGELQQKFEALFSKEEAENLMSSDKEKPTCIDIVFTPKMMTRLYQNIVLLREILEKERKEKVPLTHLDILGKISPVLKSRYQEGFQEPLSVSQRFEKIDGPLYDKDQRNFYVSTSSLPFYLNSLDISPKESMVKSVREHKALGPKAAEVELAKIIDEMAHQKQERDEKALEESLTVLKGYRTAKKRSDYLKRVDLSTLGPSQQREWIEVMKKYDDWRDLTLWNLQALQDQDFQKMPKQNLKGIPIGNLRRLDLRGCSQVTEGLFPLLAQQCVGLKYLNVSRCSQVRDINGGKTGWWQTKIHPLALPSLSFLKANHMPLLTRIWLETPRLKKLSVKHCLWLKELGKGSLYESLKCLKYRGAEKLKTDLRIYLTTEKRSLYLKEANFSTLENFEQRKLISSIKNYKDWNDLTLRNLAELEDMDFQTLSDGSFRTIPLSGLENLDLSGCHQLTESIFPLLSTHCERLKYLNVSRCVGIMAISERKPNMWRKTFRPLVFLALSSLKANNLPYLERLLLTAPHLKVIAVKNCPRLKELSSPIYESLEELKCQGAEKLLKTTNFPQMKALERKLKGILEAYIRGDVLNLSGSLKGFFGLSHSSFALKLLKEFLNSHPCILELYLRHNTDTPSVIDEEKVEESLIRKEFFKFVEALIKDNKTLIYLDLRGNPISKEDLDLLADALKDNTTLLSLKHDYPMFSIPFRKNPNDREFNLEFLESLFLESLNRSDPEFLKSGKSLREELREKFVIKPKTSGSSFFEDPPPYPGFERLRNYKKAEKNRLYQNLDSETKNSINMIFSLGGEGNKKTFLE